MSKVRPGYEAHDRELSALWQGLDDDGDDEARSIDAMRQISAPEVGPLDRLGESTG